ncbi:MAG: hypothetical protein WC091_07370 [Sulfuricellaceae bacterium]
MTQYRTIAFFTVALCIASSSFGGQGSCRHLEFAELQSRSTAELLLAYCINEITLGGLQTSITYDERMVEVAISANNRSDVNAAKIKKEKDVSDLNSCSDEQIRMEHLLKKRKIKDLDKECAKLAR